MVLGIPDVWIWLAYVLCLGGTLLCVVYGIFNWNRGDDDLPKQNKEKEEKT